MKFLKQNEEDTVFSMAPMLDVIFLLLCFSMATQLYASWEKEVDVQLPTAVSGEPPKRLPGEIKINVKADGTLIYNGNVKSYDQMGHILALIGTNTKGQPVVLRGDRNTAYNHVMKVIDLCRQNDVFNITFAVSTEEE